MRRRLFNLAAVVSMVLCVAAVIFWFSPIHISAGWGDTLQLGYGGGEWEITVDTSGFLPRTWWGHLSADDEPLFQIFTSPTCSHEDLQGGTITKVTVPSWLLALVTLLLPGAAIVRWLVRRRWAGALGCARCGYNLTGNTSGVCPECGSPVAEKAEVNA